MRRIDADELLARNRNCRDLKIKVDAMPTAMLTPEDIVLAAKVMEEVAERVDDFCSHQEACEKCRFFDMNEICKLGDINAEEYMKSFKMIHGDGYADDLYEIIEKCSRG